MSPFHIVVCMKVVPKPEEVRVDPKTWRLDRASARSEINPVDMNALEVALKIKDKIPGTTLDILTMGPPFFEPYLRVGLAMGADRLIILSDRMFAGADTLATTYTLSRGMKKCGKVDLIVCGEESSDGATGQVPAGLAEWLGFQQITAVTNVEVDEHSGTIKGRREIPGGYEVVETDLPAVVSVRIRVNEPRFLDYRIKDWAFKDAPVLYFDHAALETDPEYIGDTGSPTKVKGLKESVHRERMRKFIQGKPDEIARALSDILTPYLF